MEPIDSDKDSIIEKLLKRQKMRIIVMGVIIGILLLFCVGLYFFGLIKAIEAEKNYSDAANLRDQLELCQKEAEQQRQIAARAAEEARMLQRLSEEDAEKAREAMQKALKK